jgi:SAM-dependent methyltransferase
VDIALGQRSRAGLQFLGVAQGFAGGTLQAAAALQYEAAVPEPPLTLEERRTSVYAELDNSAAWRMDRLVTRWVAEEIYVRALPAVEEIRPAVEQWLEVTEPVSTLEMHPEVAPPAYWESGFHLTPGGWDGHDLMGAAIHELVYVYVLTPGGVGAVKTGENLNDQRTLTAREARRDDYRNILELGSGTGRYTLAVQRTYPDATVTGVELSRTSLTYAHAHASQEGHPIRWVQAAAEATGLDSDSFDLVTAYTLMHEVPTEQNVEIIAEAFRVLAPGGDLLIGEVAPYAEQTAFRAVVLDWETENRGEPHWRAALLMDLPAMLTQAGFVEIECYGIGGGVFPWITRARKPATTV